MEERYSETHQTWNKIAQLYSDKFIDMELYNDTYERFCDLLSRSDASILELGTGPGNIIRYILGLNPMLKVLATDVSTNMIGLAKKNNPTITTQILDCRNLSSLKNRFDGIICGFVIPYLSELDVVSLIADCAASMNKNGILYLSFVEGKYSNSGYISGSSGDRTYFYYYAFDTLKHVLESHNLIVQDHTAKQYKKIDNSIETHTIVIAKKIIG